MKTPYGYRARTDPSSRLIPANEPESRVSAPLRSEARVVVAAVKNPPLVDSIPPETLIQAHTSLLDGNRWEGVDIGSQSGGSGTVTIGWLSDIACYGRRLSLTGNPAGSGRHYAATVQPRVMVDPTYPALPYVYRIEDVCRAVWVPGGGTTRAACYFWVRGGQSGFAGSNDTPPPLGIGFRARAFVGQPILRWAAYVGDGAVAIVDEDLIDADDPHLLTIEFDAWEKCIRWYVDDVLMHTWTPTVLEVPDFTAVSGVAFLVGWEQVVGGLVTTCVFDHWLGPMALPVSYRAAT